MQKNVATCEVCLWVTQNNKASSLAKAALEGQSKTDILILVNTDKGTAIYAT